MDLQEEDRPEIRHSWGLLGSGWTCPCQGWDDSVKLTGFLGRAGSLTSCLTFLTWDCQAALSTAQNYTCPLHPSPKQREGGSTVAEERRLPTHPPAMRDGAWGVAMLKLKLFFLWFQRAQAGLLSPSPTSPQRTRVSNSAALSLSNILRVLNWSSNFKT